MSHSQRVNLATSTKTRPPLGQGAFPALRFSERPEMGEDMLKRPGSLWQTLISESNYFVPIHDNLECSNLAILLCPIQFWVACWNWPHNRCFFSQTFSPTTSLAEHLLWAPLGAPKLVTFLAAQAAKSGHRHLLRWPPIGGCFRLTLDTFVV